VAAAVEDALKEEVVVAGAPGCKAAEAEARECRVAAAVAPACRAEGCQAAARHGCKAAERHASRVAYQVRRGPAPAAERACKVAALPFVLPRGTPVFVPRRRARPPAPALIEDLSVPTVARKQTAARVPGCRAQERMLAWAAGPMLGPVRRRAP
jgi:hypothetical protein